MDITGETVGLRAVATTQSHNGLLDRLGPRGYCRLHRWINIAHPDVPHDRLELLGGLQGPGGPIRGHTPRRSLRTPRTPTQRAPTDEIVEHEIQEVVGRGINGGPAREQEERETSRGGLQGEQKQPEADH